MVYGREDVPGPVNLVLIEGVEREVVVNGYEESVVYFVLTVPIVVSFGVVTIVVEAVDPIVIGPILVVVVGSVCA